MPKKRFIILILLIGSVVAQQPTSSPSLQETFDWMSNTLEGWFVHHPYLRPYTKEWADKGINPYQQKIISEFSHQGCQVKFVVDTTDNDYLEDVLGRQLSYTETDTFNLKDIDPNTIKIRNSCEPHDTTQEKQTEDNCEDEAGLIMEFETRNEHPLIYRETVISSGNSAFGNWRVKNDPERAKFAKDICRTEPNNLAYCEVKELKTEPYNLTSDHLAFHSPAYTKRFVKAFKHAVELCGGKASTF